MSIDNKKINIVSDVNFDSNNITDAKINAQENTISNLEVSNFKSGVIQTTVRDTTNALDTVIPTEKAVSEALSNIQVNVVELDEGTNIDNLRQEGTFFIKNPTGTLPSAVSTSGTYWCVITQEKCYDDLNLGTYWYLQTVKFTYLGSGPGRGTLPSWQTYTRQITDYQYVMGNMWQRLDNVAEKVFSVSLASPNANATISLSSYSNDEYLSVVSVGMLSGGETRTVSTLNIDSGLSGSCRVIFKTGSGTFSITLGTYISAQLLNADILTNYSFKSNTLYDIHFQKTSYTNSYYVRVTEIDKPFVQEYFPSQTGNSGKFLTTDGTTMSWAEVQGGGSLPSQTGQSGKFLTTNGSTLSWAEVQGGGSLPDQTGQAGKFLTTNGSTASWTTVSSGTTDYTDLTNKPSINGVTLSGDVSLSSLGVQSKNLVFENTTADSWVISDPNVYPDYIYECTVSCPGATTNSFAQVVFGPGEFDSGNYANVCSTSQDSVTMYSKVNDTINIPTIIIMGV